MGQPVSLVKSSIFTNKGYSYGYSNPRNSFIPSFLIHIFFDLIFFKILKSLNVNGNDDEPDSEEIETEENPLDESELIQDYKIESLQLYDSGKPNFCQIADQSRAV